MLGVAFALLALKIRAKNSVNGGLENDMQLFKVYYGENIAKDRKCLLFVFIFY